MRFLPSIGGGIEFKRGNPADATARAISTGGGGFAVQTLMAQYKSAWEIDKAIRRGYEVLIDVFRCVDAISQNAANLEQFVQRGNRSGGTRVPDPQLEYVLNTRSNPYETSFQFRYRLSGQLLLSTKGAFVENVPNAANRTAQLQLLDPRNVEPIPHPRGEVYVTGYKVTRADGTIDTLDPDQVVWLKLKPHPTDPYAQMTPMQAAGLTVETEFLARIFNRSVVANNGRPSQLVSIGELLNQEDAEEIKYKVGGYGPQSAGRTTVIEAKDVNVANLMATPADLQYLGGLAADKEEIYIAFGTPESVLGNASGRTYDNADAERLNWWIDTMVPHCDGIAACWDVLTVGGLNDDLFVANNYEKIDVLQRALTLKKQNMQDEIAKGLRTIDSYFTESGQVPWNVPATQVLYVPAVGMLPIGKDDDTTNTVIELAEQAQGLLQPQGAPMNAQQAQQAALQGSQQAWSQQQQQIANTTAAQAMSIANKALSIVDGKIDRKELPAHDDDADDGMYLDDDADMFDDVFDTPEHPVVLVVEEKQHPYAMLRAAVEGEMDGLLSAWSRRQTSDTAARLLGVKARKGTRHWDGDGYGTKALDTQYLVDPDKWAEDLALDMQPTLNRVALQQMKRLARELDDHGLVERAVDAGKGDPHSRTPLTKLYGPGARLQLAQSQVVDPVTQMVRTAAYNQSARLQRKIAKLDSDGADAKTIEAAIRRETGSRAPWRKQLATNATTALVEAAVTKALEPVGDWVTRTWRSHVDERTRGAHLAADGQEVKGMQPFTVGGYPMLYPCEVGAPPELVCNCRCWTEVGIR